MEKQKAPEFDPGLLASIPPEKREEFKASVRKKRYLNSGLFFFIWHFNLLGLSLPMIGFLHWIWPRYDRFSQHLFGLMGYVIESFFVMVVLGFLTRELRYNLNQRGISAIHILFVVIPLCYLYFFWWRLSPERGY